MSKRLKAIKFFLSQGYFLATQTSAQTLANVIATIEELQSASISPPDGDSRFNYVSTQLCKEIPPDAFGRYINNSLRKIFNKAAEKYNKKVIKQNNKIAQLPLQDESDPEKNAVIERISLIESYRRLLNRYSIEIGLGRHFHKKPFNAQSLLDIEAQREISDSKDSAQVKALIKQRLLPINDTYKEKIKAINTELEELSFTFLAPLLASELDKIKTRLEAIRNILNETPTGVEFLVLNYLKMKFNKVIENLDLRNENFFKNNGVKALATTAEEKLYPTINRFNTLPITEIGERLYADFTTRLPAPEDTTVVSPTTKAFNDIEKILTTHKDSAQSLRGLNFLKKHPMLSAGISLKRAIQLAWESIPKDADKAKAELCEALSTIGQLYNDSFSIDTQSVEYILKLLLNIIMPIKDSQVTLFHTQRQLESFIRKQCEERLNKHVEDLNLEEQFKILTHLERKETPEEHLDFSSYIKTTSEALISELSIYDFAIVPVKKPKALGADEKHTENSISSDIKNTAFNIEAIVSNTVKTCVAEISLDWLRVTVRSGLRRRMADISDLNPLQQQSVLLKSLDMEIKCNKDADRKLFLLALQERASKLIIMQRGVTFTEEVSDLETLCTSFNHLLEIDKHRKELHSIIEAQKERGNKFSHLHLSFEAGRSLERFSYKNLTKKSDHPWKIYYETLEDQALTLSNLTAKVMAEKKEIETKLASFKQAEKTAFADYKYPKSYFSLSVENKVLSSTLKSIAGIFKDYADKAHWWYFHAGRNHTDIAYKIVSLINEGKQDHVSIRQHLIDIKNSLIAKGVLNLEGSFSRRLHYCLDILDELKPQAATGLFDSPGTYCYPK